MAAGQQRGAAVRRPASVTEPSRSRRVRQSNGRTGVLGGPAFISEQAEEQHHLDVLRDSAADGVTKATARLELARLYERHGHFAEAVEMYERNVWDGVRTPATYAGLAAAYRQLGRDDLADAALEQVRRQGGAAGPAQPDAVEITAPLPRSQRRRSAEPAGRSAVPASRQPDTQRIRAPRPAAEAGARGAVRQSAESGARRAGRQTAQMDETDSGTLRQIQDAISPFLAGQAGRRTLVVSTVLLPIALGLVIFAGVVLTSARPRTTEQAAAPTPAPVATVAPTAAEAAAAPNPAVPPALAQPPAPANLVVNNVGSEGVSLRRTPGTSGNRIKVWKDGTQMADLGESADQDGKAWRKVRDPDGNVGWTASEFLADPSVRAMGASGAPVAAAPSFASGGLGLTRAEWEKGHGQPSRSSIFLEYDSGRLVVGLLESNVWHIERIWMRNEAVSLDAAREDARAYLPADANLAQTVDRGDGKVIDVYTSTALAGRFGPTAWNGGTSGTFTIQYKLRAPSDRMVVSAMFRLGDAGI